MSSLVLANWQSCNNKSVVNNYFQGNCHYQEPIIHPTFRLNNLIFSYADIPLHGQRSTITKKAGEAQWLRWYFHMTSICYANWTIALITDTLTNLDQSNITIIVTLPRALFPVPVISVCSAWSHFSLLTTWSRGAATPFSPLAPSRPSRPGDPLCPLTQLRPGRPGDPCKHVFEFCVT